MDKLTQLKSSARAWDNQRGPNYFIRVDKEPKLAMIAQFQPSYARLVPVCHQMAEGQQSDQSYADTSRASFVCKQSAVLEGMHLTIQNDKLLKRIGELKKQQQQQLLKTAIFTNKIDENRQRIELLKSKSNLNTQRKLRQPRIIKIKLDLSSKKSSVLNPQQNEECSQACEQKLASTANSQAWLDEWEGQCSLWNHPPIKLISGLKSKKTIEIIKKVNQDAKYPQMGRSKTILSLKNHKSNIKMPERVFEAELISEKTKTSLKTMRKDVLVKSVPLKF